MNLSVSMPYSTTMMDFICNSSPSGAELKAAFQRNQIRASSSDAQKNSKSLTLKSDVSSPIPSLLSKSFVANPLNTSSDSLGFHHLEEQNSRYYVDTSMERSSQGYLTCNQLEYAPPGGYLSNFIQKNGFFADKMQKDDKPNVTSMIGGSYKIPDSIESWDLFLLNYSRDIANSVPLFLSEVAEPVHCLFFELDGLKAKQAATFMSYASNADETWSEEVKLKICQLACKTVSEFVSPTIRALDPEVKSMLDREEKDGSSQRQWEIELELRANDMGVTGQMESLFRSSHSSASSSSSVNKELMKAKVQLMHRKKYLEEQRYNEMLDIEKAEVQKLFPDTLHPCFVSTKYSKHNFQLAETPDCARLHIVFRTVIVDIDTHLQIADRFAELLDKEMPYPRKFGGLNECKWSDIIDFDAFSASAKINMRFNFSCKAMACQACVAEARTNRSRGSKKTMKEQQADAPQHDVGCEQGLVRHLEHYRLKYVLDDNGMIMSSPMQHLDVDETKFSSREAYLMSPENRQKMMQAKIDLINCQLRWTRIRTLNARPSSFLIRPKREFYITKNRLMTEHQYQDVTNQGIIDRKFKAKIQTGELIPLSMEDPLVSNTFVPLFQKVNCEEYRLLRPEKVMRKFVKNKVPQQLLQYVIQVEGPNCRMCHNKPGTFPREKSHKSSKIYFTVEKDGSVLQRCWSNKENVGRMNGTKCTAFSHCVGRLSLDQVAQLFPEQTKNRYAPKLDTVGKQYKVVEKFVDPEDPNGGVAEIRETMVHLYAMVPGRGAAMKFVPVPPESPIIQTQENVVNDFDFDSALGPIPLPSGKGRNKSILYSEENSTGSVSLNSSQVTASQESQSMGQDDANFIAETLKKPGAAVFSSSMSKSTNAAATNAMKRKFPSFSDYSMPSLPVSSVQSSICKSNSQKEEKVKRQKFQSTFPTFK